MSDAAQYIVAAGAILKPLHLKLFHVTCVVYLLHNCAMNIQSHYENVDQLITKVKSVTLKNKTHKPKSLPLVARRSLLLRDGEAG